MGFFSTFAALKLHEATDRTARAENVAWLAQQSLSFRTRWANRVIESSVLSHPDVIAKVNRAVWDRELEGVASRGRFFHHLAVLGVAVLTAWIPLAFFPKGDTSSGSTFAIFIWLVGMIVVWYVIKAVGIRTDAAAVNRKFATNGWEVSTLVADSGSLAASKAQAAADAQVAAAAKRKKDLFG